MAITPSSPVPASAKGRRKLQVRLTVALALAGLVVVGGLAGLGYYLLRPRAEASRPIVLIHSPSEGEQVAVGQAVTLHAVAEGKDPIVRLELWVDGQLEKAQRGDTGGNSSPLPLVAAWRPAAGGSHTLIARAFDARGGRAQAEVTVEAIAEADRDGDRVPDEADACADAAGYASTGGCPDADGDGIADADDACPDQAGVAEGNGCPVTAAGDRDGDGVADADDRCPDEPGMDTFFGCPLPEDRDGDHIADAEDACPDAPGTMELDGCPDSDGDGIVDRDDACPEEPGLPETGCPAPAEGDRDGDGIADADDQCPDEPGVPTGLGCPDADGDGVPDGDDGCPSEPGPADHGGCPTPAAVGLDIGVGEGVEVACIDIDEDGVCDDEDLCPGVGGPPERGGCPDTGAGDRDGDGIADDVDLCPREAGLPEHAGCPPPGEGEDSDGDGIPDAEELRLVPMGLTGLVVPRRAPHVAVEFQAIDLQVSDDFDGVYLYPTMVGGAQERYAFEPLGERYWDIASELGSRRLLVPDGENLDLVIEGGGDIEFLGPEGGWGSYYDLGEVVASHPPSDWDGHVITARSSGGDGGRWFQVRYRLCAVSCDEAAFPAPELFMYTYASDTRLIWRWDGDRTQLQGYRLWMDGNLIQELAADDDTDISVSRLAASCGRERRFYVTASAGPGRQSPPSNEVVFESPPCPRVVRVTFESIDTGEMGDDEWWADGESVGPVYGNFWAQGAGTERLEFWAVDYGEWAWEREDGLRLTHNTHYAVQDIFDRIWNWIQGSMSSPYRVAECNYVTVELNAYQTLVVGGAIWDSDSGIDDDTLFDGQLRISSADLAPGRYTVSDRNIELTVLVDIIVGPEAGDRPDLVISDITTHAGSGQLRIHVFNNAADLVDTDITVALARVSTNELLGTWTWRGISIPSGGTRILQGSDLVMEAEDLRAIVDPDNRIEEMDEGNNIRETGG